MSSLASLSMNIIFLSHSSNLSWVISSSHVHHDIILTQAITYHICKDWSEVFFHVLLHKKCQWINKYFYKKLLWNFNKKKLKLKMQQFLGPQTTGLQTNVSGKKTKRPNLSKQPESFVLEIDYVQCASINVSLNFGRKGIRKHERMHIFDG